MCCYTGAATGESTEAAWPTAKLAETPLAAGAVGAGNHTRSGAEQRARATAVATLVAAQNGTSGVLAGGKHARRRAAWAMPRPGSELGHLFADADQLTR